MVKTTDTDIIRFKYSALPSLFLLIFIWAVKIIEISNNTSFFELGVYPRKAHGLVGILVAIFIHSDFNHLISNTISLFILLTGLIYFYRDLSYRVFIFIWIASGIMVWLGARQSYHIGASGLIYGVASFLFFSGIVRRDVRLMSISLLVVFLYGGLIWGILPIFPRISWEYHLFGSICGLVVAIIYRNQGPERKKWSWEYEEDTEDSNADNEAQSEYILEDVDEFKQKF